MHHLGFGLRAPHTSWYLPNFVFWLDIIGSANARVLISQMLVWLGMLFDFCGWVQNIDIDPLQTPILEGPQRARRLPLRFKESIARNAAQGDGFHSGRHMLHIMQRFRIASAIKQVKGGNKWNDFALMRYFTACKAWMQNVKDLIFSLAMDGTTLSGKEYLFCTMYAGGRACWCPPIAPKHISNHQLQML